MVFISLIISLKSLLDILFRCLLDLVRLYRCFHRLAHPHDIVDVDNFIEGYCRLHLRYFILTRLIVNVHH